MSFDAIYWAGFFDGEGHVELSYIPYKRYLYGRYLFQVWIDQRTKDPSELFGEIISNFGGDTFEHKEYPGSYRWYASGLNGRRFLEAIVPFLRLKKRQAELGIELQKHMQYCKELKVGILSKVERLERDKILAEYYDSINSSNRRRKRKFALQYENDNPLAGEKN